MPALTYQYRSNKDNASLEARLSFTHSGKRYSFYTRSKVEVSRSFWKEYQDGINFRDVVKSNRKKEVEDHTRDLRNYVLNEFDKAQTSAIDKDWLKNTVHTYYYPPEPDTFEVIPYSLLGYWDYYLNIRKHELSNVEQNKFKVTKHKLERYEKETAQNIEIRDIKDDFKNDFIEYCQSENYSQNTIKKDLALIKRVCNHAKMKGVLVSPELDNLKIKSEKTPKIYLSFVELQKIKELQGLTDYLDNARDWLIISCYTGQRVSDFMRFTSKMLRREKGATFLDITQVKTGKIVTIPVLPEVVELLDKRNGQFPRPISDQRYNEWIKEVCRRAKIDKNISGRLATNLNPDGDTQIRNVLGEYEKWRLVTSHIGRRSFATNYYGKIPTSYLKNITGHGTETMLLSYIGKSSKDTAFEAYELLMNAK